jgi:hypothetical protein
MNGNQVIVMFEIPCGSQKKYLLVTVTGVSHRCTNLDQAGVRRDSRRLIHRGRDRGGREQIDLMKREASVSRTPVTYELSYPDEAKHKGKNGFIMSAITTATPRRYGPEEAERNCAEWDKLMQHCWSGENSSILMPD